MLNKVSVQIAHPFDNLMKNANEEHGAQHLVLFLA